MTRAPYGMAVSFIDEMDTKCRECIEWPYSKNHNGYGVVWLNGKVFRAHRVSFEKHIGEIGKGMVVIHDCDNPACVNPNHLKIGSQKDNLADMHRKNRAAKGGHHGNSKLSESDVIAAKQKHKSGISIYRLAKLYDVNWTTMNRAVQGDTWRHIP